MKTILTLFVLFGFLALSSLFGYWVWDELGDVEMSHHGWIALILGAVLTFLVGAGLMTLVFISSRRGYDDRANRPDD
jgi:NADH:ubiquinone oxidoreductase subunit 5 (subunit L)/multisubunit Na+/H+ antiporter MnhA subunit